MKPSLCFVAVFTAFALLGQASARTFSGGVTDQVVISNNGASLAKESGLHQDLSLLTLADPTIFGPALLHQFRAHSCC
jgi:hypothetical protein